MEFFDKISKKASEAYKITADKTGKIAKETKIKFKIGELKSQVEDLYEEIGQKVYEKYANKEVEIENELSELCIKIDVLVDDIERLQKECLELNDKKQCCNCNAEIDKQAKFCHSCGAKQEEKEQENIEVEIVETVECEIVENDKKENNENQSNLEKTIEVESNVQTDEQDK